MPTYRREMDMEFKEVRREIYNLRIDLTRMETRIEALEKAVAYLTQKFDSHTWHLILGVLVIVISQWLIGFLQTPQGLRIP